MAGRCWIFDFELSSLGSVALDAAYLLAPFPSCWCFSALPAEVTTETMAVYRHDMRAAGLTLDADWESSLVAAQACWLLSRAEVLRRSLEEDREWGTTTTRPRLLAWLRTFSVGAGGCGRFPRLQALANDLADLLVSRWPGVVIPSYPAFASSQSVVAKVPAWWPAEP